MKTCRRLLDFIQIIDAEGNVRACGWNIDNVIGNIQKDSIVDILNGKKAKELRAQIAKGDYSNCPSDNCPYISNENMESILVDYKEDEIIYPDTIHLAYEGNCNYSCTCCTSYKHMQDTRENDYTQLYDTLEDRLKPILPYVKHIGANGRGEVFASPRIMNVLSQWKPKAPENEISVDIETNGSLFNEKNWKRIENLGQYYLSVYVTIMSFDELTYQYLSGTKLAIETIIDNLLFIKGLRDKNIINYLEIATVMQELNFREMPSFTERCLNDFGADTVRIRPVMPGGRLTSNEQWIMDVRNPEHPYYELCRRVMEHKIFKDPRVLLWSNVLPSNRGKMPYYYELERAEKRIERQNGVLRIIKAIMEDAEFSGSICKLLNGRKLGVFGGLGTLGKLLISTIEKDVPISTIFDKNQSLQTYHGIQIRTIEYAKDFDGLIIVSPYGMYEEMKKELDNAGFCGESVSLEYCIKES